jgi:hypothetical protein
MRLKRIILAKKHITDGGEWKRRQKMPRTHFPLLKSKSYQIPAKWDAWRVVRFEALGRSFRLLIAFDVGYEEYRAWLALDRGEDMVLLARLEFHGSHPGWHCHANCDDPHVRISGVVKGFGDRRYPKARRFHRHQQFNVAEHNALAIAFRFYGIGANGAPTYGELL